MSIRNPGLRLLYNEAKIKIDRRSHPYRMRPAINGFSHGLKSVPRTLFTSPYGEAALSNPESDGKKKSHTFRCGFWQRMRDSNPRKRSQSPVCYRYTNPLCLADNTVIIRLFSKKSSTFFKIFEIFLQGRVAPPLYHFYSSTGCRTTKLWLSRVSSFSPMTTLPKLYRQQYLPSSSSFLVSLPGFTASR